VNLWRLGKASVSSAGLLLAALAWLPMQASEAKDAAMDERTGGDTTVFATGSNAFSFPLATLSDAEAARFAVGNSFFRRNWVQAPASAQARDGLGPHFMARSCGGCHLHDGRAAPPTAANEPQPAGLLMRLSVPGLGQHGGVVPEPTYGEQLTNAANSGVAPEGQVVVSQRPLHGRFKDGTPYTLQQPIYHFKNLAHGPLAHSTLSSPRIAPQLAGVGLLDAINEADILRNAQLQSEQPGPIKGQPNRVWDAFAGALRVGKFGWKANTASLAHQTAAAFQGDMGITSRLFPHETCTPAQTDCLKAPRGGPGGQGPEIDDTTLAHVVFYQSALAPAARREPTDRATRQGQALFAQAQCAACHQPSYTTGTAPFAAFSSPRVEGQRIWPYTDLLLHNMGPLLADGRPDFEANGQQWKTPPLWGIGLIKDVNGHTQLLHDGRARGVLEAILWHGGEAEAAKQHVLKFNRTEREALVKFVESL
jgi:CxxC motif-containing protein (DUF1111 family)